MKTVCVLLASSLNNDARVIKTIQTISKENQVDIYFIDTQEFSQNIFNKNVSLKRVIPKEDSFVRKLISHTYFYRSFLFLEEEILKSRKVYDVIYANDLPTLLPAHNLSNQFHAKLIYDSHEIFCETLNQFFPTSSSSLKKPLYSILLNSMKYLGVKKERKLIKAVDEFITVNKTILDYFNTIYEISNGHVLMNLPRLQEAISKPKDYRTDFSWSRSSFIFIYQGVLNKGRGLELIINAFNQTENKNKLVIVGDGNLRSELEYQVKQLNLEQRVKFIGRIPLNELSEYTKGADAGLNILEDLNLSKKYASPNKLFEYMHSGLPVICSSTIENDKVLNRFKIGVSVKNDSNSISEGLDRVIKLKNNSTIIESLSEASQYYNWERQERTLLDIIRK